MADVELKILADTKEALTSIQSFSDNAATALKGFAIAAAAFLGGRALIGAIDSFITASSESETAINNMNIAMASAGSYSEKASKHMQDFASSMQTATGISDELILNQIAVARNFTKTNDSAEKLTKAAIELSAATGKDLDSSVQALAKSLEGVGGAIGKTLPATKGFTEAQLKAGAAIDFILSRFSGVAESKMQSFGGAIKGVSNAFDDMKEILGDVVTKNSVIIEIIGIVRKAFISFTEILKTHKVIIEELVTGAIKLLIATIPFVIKSIENLILAFGYLTVGTYKTTSVISNFIAVLLEFKVVALIFNAIKDAILIIDSLIYRLIRPFTYLLSLIPGIGSTFEDMTNSMNESISQFDSAVFTDMATGSQKAFSNLGISTEKTMENIAGFIDKSKTVMDDFNGVLDDSVAKVLDLNSTQVDSGKKAVETLNANSKSVRLLSIELADLKKLAEEAFKNPWNFIVNTFFESAKKTIAGFSKIVTEVQTWVADHPIIIQAVSAGVGLLDSIFKSGAGSVKKIQDELESAIKVVINQLDSAISEALSAKNEALRIIEVDFTSSIAEVNKGISNTADEIQQKFTNAIDDINAQLLKDNNEYTQQVADLNNELLNGKIDEIKYSISLGKLNKNIDDSKLKAQEKLSLAERNRSQDEAANKISLAQKIKALEDKRIEDIKKANIKYEADILGLRIKNETEIEKLRADNAIKINEQNEKNVQAAAKVSGSFADAVGAAFGLPPIFASLIQMLSAPPEVWQGIITGLINGIPTVILRIVENIPTIITSFIDEFILGVPKVVDAIVFGIPKIITAFVEKVPSIITAMVNNLPAFTAAIVEAAIAFSIYMKTIGPIWNAIVTLGGIIWNLAVTASGTVWNAAVAASGAFLTGLFASIGAGLTAAGAWLAGVFVAMGPILITLGTILLYIAAAAAVIYSLTIIAKELNDALTKSSASISLFASNISGVFDKIVESLNAVIKELGKLVNTILSAISQILTSALTFIVNLGKSIVNSAIDFVKSILNGAGGFVNEILRGAGSFIQKLIDGIKNSLPKIDVGGGGGGGGIDFIGAVRDFFGKAKGGTVPDGFPNDNFPATLTSGEMIIPRNDVDRLSAFLDKQQNQTNNSSSDLVTLLKQAIGSSQMGQSINVTLQVGEKELANVILDLNRRGFRTA